MCESCLAECHTLGEVVPGLFLVQAQKTWKHIEEGHYGLVRSNGPDVVWPGPLMPDPFDGWTDDQINALSDDEITGPTMAAYDAQVKVFSEACRTQLHLTTALHIALLCIKAGYDWEMDGSLEHWLAHRMAVLSQSAPPAPPHVTEP